MRTQGTARGDGVDGASGGGRRERAPRPAGFSMIEIVVVVAIMAVIAGMAVPVITTQITRSKVEDTRNELRALVPAVESYFQDCRRFPPTFADLEQDRSKVAGWSGPYTTALLAGKPGADLSLEKDGWNVSYVVKVESSSAIRITSPGPDKTAGTQDDLEQVIDVTPIRRDETQREVDVLNTAIQAYNAQFLGKDPLQRPITKTLQQLASKGFLPAPYDHLRTDGWDMDYVENPVGKSPVVAVTSENLGDVVYGGGSQKGGKGDEKKGGKGDEKKDGKKGGK